MTDVLLVKLTAVLLSLSALLAQAQHQQGKPLFAGPISTYTWFLNGTSLTPSVNSWTVTTAGGDLATSTSNTALTLAATDISSQSMIEMTPNVGALTLTLPASSTLSALAPNAGNTYRYRIYNATTSAFAITIAAGTGETLVQATSSPINSLRSATLDFTRLTSTNFSVFYNAGF